MDHNLTSSGNTGQAAAGLLNETIPTLNSKSTNFLRCQVSSGTLVYLSKFKPKLNSPLISNLNFLKCTSLL